jgi:hypothetical protein
LGGRLLYQLKNLRLVAAYTLAVLSSPVAILQAAETYLPLKQSVSMEQLSPYLDRIVIITGAEFVNARRNSREADLLRSLPRKLEGKAKVIGVDISYLSIEGAEEALLSEWKHSQLPIVQCGDDESAELHSMAKSAGAKNIAFGHCLAIFDYSPLAAWFINHNWIHKRWAKTDKFIVPIAVDGEFPISLLMFLFGGGDPSAVKKAGLISVTNFTEKGFRKVAFRDLVEGTVDLKTLDGKYVFLGTDHYYLDAFQNGRGEQFNGVFVHALSLAVLLRAEALLSSESLQPSSSSAQEIPH